MAAQFVTARDTISGVVGTVPASYLDHPVLGKHLELVDSDAKDLNKDLHKPRAARKKASTPVESSDEPSWASEFPTLDGADL